MCKLYSAKLQTAFRDLAKAMVDTSRNQPTLPGIFPDGMAPIVMTRPSDGQRELMMMRWSLLPPPLPFRCHCAAAPAENVNPRRVRGQGYWQRRAPIIS